LDIIIYSPLVASNYQTFVELALLLIEFYKKNIVKIIGRLDS